MAKNRQKKEPFGTVLQKFFYLISLPNWISEEDFVLNVIIFPKAGWPLWSRNLSSGDPLLWFKGHSLHIFHVFFCTTLSQSPTDIIPHCSYNIQGQITLAFLHSSQIVINFFFPLTEAPFPTLHSVTVSITEDKQTWLSPSHWAFAW